MIKILIHRRDELRASKIMVDRAMADPKIRFAWNSVVTDVLGDEKVTGVRLRDTITATLRPSMLEFMDSVAINAVEDHLRMGLDREAAAMLATALCAMKEGGCSIARMM